MDVIDATRAGLSRLLGMIVGQAMNDGMIGIELGIAPDTGDSWMKYFGPSSGESTGAWEMVAPPPECYPILFQICVSLARIRPQFPLNGALAAKQGRRRLDIEFQSDRLDSFQLLWGGSPPRPQLPLTP